MDVYTETLTNPDGESITVSWMREEVTGYDLAKENAGMREYAFDADHCPVYWDGNSGLRLWAEKVMQFNGDISVIYQARRVDTVEELEPGCYVFHED